MQGERYLATLECASCGTKGAAEYEYKEAPPHHRGRIDQELVSVRGVFLMASSHDSEICCAHCQAKVLMPNAA
jgi:hypothetical protein